jgi:hypothetical protein
MHHCEASLLYSGGPDKNNHSNINIGETKIEFLNSEKYLNIPYLKVLLNVKLKRDKLRNKRMMRMQLGNAKTQINIDKVARRSETKLSRHPSVDENSPRLIPQINQDKSLSNGEGKNSEARKIEPVQLPKRDPHPVKAGHLFLIETSFEELQSEYEEHSNEGLIGYQSHRDGEGIEDKLEIAMKRYR